jgi:hypothetical protein
VEKDRTQRYAESLERIVRNDYQYVKDTIPDFQDLCRIVTPEKNVPPKIIVDIREMYKEMRNRMTEIKAVRQLLQGKYRQYYRRDPLRDKEIMEFGFIVKNAYSRFEYILLQKQKQEAIRAKEKEQAAAAKGKGPLFHWFRSQEHQVGLLKAVRLLGELDYQAPPEEIGRERREVAENRPRSLTLFILAASPAAIDTFQSKVRFREHDVVERYGEGVFRGLLVHLRQIDPTELEVLFRRFTGACGDPKVRCLLFTVRSAKDLEGDHARSIEKIIETMAQGEVRALSV